MTKYAMLLSAKNKESLNQFLEFLKNNTTRNFQIVTKVLKKKKIEKKFSVLKSPHVNKTAQEHFKYEHYSVSLSFYSHDIKKNLFFLKKVKNQLFPEVRITMKGEHSRKVKVSAKHFLYPDTIKFCSLKSDQKSQKQMSLLNDTTLLKKTVSYLKVLDYYGNHTLNKFR